jgi:hypothetical protein
MMKSLAAVAAFLLASLVGTEQPGGYEGYDA